MPLEGAMDILENISEESSESYIYLGECVSKSGDSLMIAKYENRCFAIVLSQKRRPTVIPIPDRTLKCVFEGNTENSKRPEYETRIDLIEDIAEETLKTFKKDYSDEYLKLKIAEIV